MNIAISDNFVLNAKTRLTHMEYNISFIATQFIFLCNPLICVKIKQNSAANCDPRVVNSLGKASPTLS